jgi:hypothetical protein
MTITVPTSAQIASALEGAARAVAMLIALVYVAGEMTGKSVHNLSDWLAEFTRQPLQTIIDAIPVREPQPELLTVLGAEILEPEALELEIREFEAKQPVARRKPARARKTAVAAS